MYGFTECCDGDFTNISCWLLLLSVPTFFFVGSSGAVDKLEARGKFFLVF
jgi:hypothetical protein